MTSPTKPIFVREITLPDSTKLLRPIPFYVGLNKVGKVATTRLILTNGGVVVDHPGRHNSNIISLVDTNARARRNGPIAYAVDYVQRCIDEGKLLDLEPFRRVPTPSSGRPPFGSAPLGRRRKKVPAEEEEDTGKRAEKNNTALPKDDRRTGGTEGTEREQVKKPDGDRAAGEHDRVAKQKSPKQGREEDSDGRKKDQPVQPSTPSPTPVAPSNPADAPTQPPDCPPEQPPPKEVPPPEATENANSAIPVRSPSNNAWSGFEDNILRELYHDAKENYKTNDKDLSGLMSIPFWTKLEKAKLLPPRRTSGECFLRIRKLRRRRPKKPNRSSPQRKAVEEQSNSDTESVPLGKPRASGAAIGNASPQEKSQSSSSVHTPVQKVLRKPPWRTAKELRIVRIVKNLARQGGVSERRAFRALRSERGDRRRAMSILQRKAG